MAAGRSALRRAASTQLANRPSLYRGRHATSWRRTLGGALGRGFHWGGRVPHGLIRAEVHACLLDLRGQGRACETQRRTGRLLGELSKVLSEPCFLALACSLLQRFARDILKLGAPGAHQGRPALLDVLIKSDAIDLQPRGMDQILVPLGSVHGLLGRLADADDLIHFQELQGAPEAGQDVRVVGRTVTPAAARGSAAGDLAQGVGGALERVQDVLLEEVGAGGESSSLIGGLAARPQSGGRLERPRGVTRALAALETVGELENRRCSGQQLLGRARRVRRLRSCELPRRPVDVGIDRCAECPGKLLPRHGRRDELPRESALPLHRAGKHPGPELVQLGPHVLHHLGNGRDGQGRLEDIWEAGPDVGWRVLRRSCAPRGHDARQTPNRSILHELRRRCLEALHGVLRHVREVPRINVLRDPHGVFRRRGEVQQYVHESLGRGYRNLLSRLGRRGRLEMLRRADDGELQIFQRPWTELRPTGQVLRQSI
mmetsp:Transcript_87540/g.237311  ORF Transcript_87540/g.237311 Transcript_87540/m.237311 type:complete len:488 (-) Transcript_87540:418-1881(-)